MKTDHLSDLMIQEYALENSQQPDVLQHLDACTDCKTKVLMYQNIIAGIEALPSAAFDFNVFDQVRSKIEKRSSAASYAHLLWLFSLLGIGTIVITGYLFGKYVGHLFLLGATDMTLYLAQTIVIGLFLVSGIEMTKKYKRQMEAINFT